MSKCADVEEGRCFGVFGTFQKEWLVGIDPLPYGVGWFLVMVLDIVEED
jgi:hypothetical protein